MITSDKKISIEFLYDDLIITKGHRGNSFVAPPGYQLAVHVPSYNWIVLDNVYIADSSHIADCFDNQHTYFVDMRDKSVMWMLSKISSSKSDPYADWNRAMGVL